MASRPEKSETDIRVTHEQLDEMLDRAEKYYWQPFEELSKKSARHKNNLLVGVYLFDDGFTITESAACVDPANFQVGIGKDIIREKIKDRLWQLEGYALNRKLDNERLAHYKRLERN